jgi:hypothetical protein
VLFLPIKIGLNNAALLHVFCLMLV